MDRLDIHDSSGEFKYYLERINNSSMSDKQKKRIHRFVEEAQLGKNSKKIVGHRRLIANLQSFFRLHDYFKKDFEDLNEKELEQFYKDLQNNKIRKANGGIYKQNSKDELIKNLKRYLKWAWNDEKKYNTHARWMREKEEIPEIPAITLDQIKKVVDTMQYDRDKTLTMLAFDSGARIEELLNLKIRDIQRRTKKDGEEYYAIKIDGTKTKEAKREISVPLASPLLTQWLKEHPSINDKEAYLFDITYDAFRKVLRMNGKKAIQMVITPHQLRHSSATYYCPLINNDRMFCYRYGWAFGSKQARRYIDRNRLGDTAQEELDNIIKVSKMQDLEKEFEDFKEGLKPLTPYLEAIAEAMERMQKTGKREANIHIKLNTKKS